MDLHVLVDRAQELIRPVVEYLHDHRDVDMELFRKVRGVLIEIDADRAA